jgi:hypothetical protein
LGFTGVRYGAAAGGSRKWLLTFTPHEADAVADRSRFLQALDEALVRWEGPPERLPSWREYARDAAEVC